MKHLICPICRSRIVVADADLGKPIRCPGCDEPYPAKEPDAAEAGAVIIDAPAPVVAPVKSRGWLLPIAAGLILCASCVVCVGVGAITSVYLWNRQPDGPARPIVQIPGPKDEAKQPPVDTPLPADTPEPVGKPEADMPADPALKLPAELPANPPVKWAMPLTGDPDKAEVLVLDLDAAVLRNDDIYFTSGPRPKIGYFGQIGKGAKGAKPFMHRFHLFDPETKQTISSEIPYASFSPVRRSLSPDGRFIATDVRLEGVGISLRVSIWQVGTDEPVVKEWALPPSADNPKGLLRNYFFAGNDQLVTVTLSGYFEWWQVPEMRVVKQYQAPSKSLNSVVVLGPDRRRCALFEKDRFRIIDLVKGESICETPPLTPIPGKPSVYPSNNSTSFSRDGSMLACVIHHATADPTIFYYDTATGKPIGRPATVHQRDLAQFNLGWFGARHVFVYDRFLGRPVGIYRIGDAAHCAMLSGPPNKVHVAAHAPDDRLWYVAPGAFNAPSSLIATEMPLSIEMATPERPLQLTLGTKGLLR